MKWTAYDDMNMYARAYACVLGAKVYISTLSVGQGKGHCRWEVVSVDANTIDSN